MLFAIRFQILSQPYKTLALVKRCILGRIWCVVVRIRINATAYEIELVILSPTTKKNKSKTTRWCDFFWAAPLPYVRYLRIHIGGGRVRIEKKQERIPDANLQ